MIELDNHTLCLVLFQLFHVTVLIVVVGLLTRLVCCRRPHLAHLLWMVVILKCVTPPLWSSPTGAFSWAQVQVGVTSTSSTPENLNPLYLEGVPLADDESLERSLVGALPQEKVPRQRTEQVEGGHQDHPGSCGRSRHRAGP